MLEKAQRLVQPSARSAVPPFMVMDVMAAAARLEARPFASGAVRRRSLAVAIPNSNPLIGQLRDQMIAVEIPALILARFRIPHFERQIGGSQRTSNAKLVPRHEANRGLAPLPWNQFH